MLFHSLLCHKIFLSDLDLIISCLILWFYLYLVYLGNLHALINDLHDIQGRLRQLKLCDQCILRLAKSKDFSRFGMSNNGI